MARTDLKDANKALSTFLTDSKKTPKSPAEFEVQLNTYHKTINTLYSLQESPLTDIKHTKVQSEGRALFTKLLTYKALAEHKNTRNYKNNLALSQVVLDDFETRIKTLEAPILKEAMDRLKFEQKCVTEFVAHSAASVRGMNEKTAALKANLSSRLTTLNDSINILLSKEVQADVAPTDVAPTDVAPTFVAPTDVAPTDVAPTDVAPTDVAPVDKFTPALDNLKRVKLEDNSEVSPSLQKLLTKLDGLNEQYKASSINAMDALYNYCQAIALRPDGEDDADRNERLANSITLLEKAIAPLQGHSNPILKNIGIAFAAVGAALLAAVGVASLVVLLAPASAAAAALTLPTAAVASMVGVGTVSGVVGLLGLFGARSTGLHKSATDLVANLEQHPEDVQNTEMTA